jgi:uncharacterized membrane protein
MTDENGKRRKIGYWATTAIIALAIGAGGVLDIVRPPDVVELVKHLGYPLYFIRMLGVFKVAGTVVLLAPGLRRLKEWAYAGVLIDLIAAAVSHIAVGDPIIDAVPPVVLLVVLLASHQLRPASRRLPD